MKKTILTVATILAICISSSAQTKKKKKTIKIQQSTISGINSTAVGMNVTTSVGLYSNKPTSISVDADSIGK